MAHSVVDMVAFAIQHLTAQGFAPVRVELIEADFARLQHEIDSGVAPDWLMIGWPEEVGGVALLKLRAVQHSAVVATRPDRDTARFII